MSISDWSSDVCSSDLVRRDLRHLHRDRRGRDHLFPAAALVSEVIPVRLSTQVDQILTESRAFSAATDWVSRRHSSRRSASSVCASPSSTARVAMRAASIALGGLGSAGWEEQKYEIK